MNIVFRQKPLWFTIGERSRLERLLFGQGFNDFRKSYVHMFMEDCGNIVPYRDRSGAGSFFKLTTNDEELASRIVQALDTHDRGRDLDSTMRSFLESTTHSLLMYRKAYAFFDTNADDVDGGMSIRVIEPTPAFVFSVLGQCFQYVPAGTRRWPVADHSDRARAQLRHLDRSRLMRILLPANLDALCRNTMHDLAVLSDLNYPDLEKLWSNPTLENPNPKGGLFDFTEFRRRFDIALFKAIRRTGWTARNYSGDEKSDFFSCVNRLRFKRFQAELRDSILLQMNSQIQIIFRSVRSDFEFRVEPSSLLDQGAISALEAKLYEGQVSFKEVIQLTFDS